MQKFSWTSHCPARANPVNFRYAGSEDLAILPTVTTTHPIRKSFSAAQPQPNDLGEVKAFVPRWALCRAALKGATSSPT